MEHKYKIGDIVCINPEANFSDFSVESRDYFRDLAKRKVRFKITTDNNNSFPYKLEELSKIEKSLPTPHYKASEIVLYKMNLWQGVKR